MCAKESEMQSLCTKKYVEDTKMHAGDADALYTKMHAGDANALCMSEIPRCIPVTLSCILKIPKYLLIYQNAYRIYQSMLDVPRDAC